MNVLHLMQRFQEHCGSKETVLTFGKYFDLTSREGLFQSIEYFNQSLSIDTETNAESEDDDKSLRK